MAGTLIVLGTAQDGGNPQLGSRGRGRPRLVSSVAVVMDDGSTLLADVSPDVKAQVARLSEVEAYQARSARNAVDHITLTHGHMGHYTGLVQFGKEAHNADRIPTWVTPSMAAFLTANEPWRSLVERGHLDLRSGFGPVVLEPGLSLRLVPVPHRAELTDTVGISINDEVLFVPDIDSWADWPDAQQEVARHRVCLLDASFSSLDEIPGRDLGQIPHPLVSDTIERFGHLAADRRLILTHLNHSNPVAEPDSEAAAVVRSAGFEVAEDLMEIHLDGN
ncbi:MAG: MBL fold metallo-hydrolase [Acidimicrobiia bacterium]|nr:MBL fold metallo-hydrolase [Acidimicrobiia bacterium]